MRKINLKIATSWNELSNKQLENICFQIECYHFENKVSPEKEIENRTRLYVSVSKELLRGNPFKNIRLALKEIQPKAYADLTNFIFTKNTRTNFINKIKTNSTVFYSPAKRLRNVSIGEYSFADSLFYHWRQTNKIEYLNALIATLYREKDNTSSSIDERKEFNKLFVDDDSKKLKSISYKQKLSIAYTFEGCRNYFIDTYKNVFPKKEVNQPTLNSKYTPFGEIILDKIKGDPSKLKNTQKLLTSDFLAIYDKDIKDLK